MTDYYKHLDEIEESRRIPSLHFKMKELIDAVAHNESVGLIDVIADDVALEVLLIDEDEGHRGIQPYSDLFTDIIKNYRLTNYYNGNAGEKKLNQKNLKES